MTSFVNVVLEYEDSLSAYPNKTCISFSQKKMHHAAFRPGDQFYLSKRTF